MSDWPQEYRCVDLGGLVDGPYAIRPIRWSDREPARRWRNDQLRILRQARPLTEAEQSAYYREVVRPQLTAERPEQVLVGILLDERLIGYGGLVHISWAHRRAEVSFITELERQSPHVFEADLSAFLRLAIRLAQRMELHRLTTEAYAFRADYVEVAEQVGFELEGRLRDHVLVDGSYADSLLHGLLLPGEPGG